MITVVSCPHAPRGQEAAFQLEMEADALLQDPDQRNGKEENIRSK